MKKAGTKKVVTKKVETKVDRYEVKVYEPARNNDTIVWGWPNKGEKLIINETFETRCEAISAAKRLLEEHPEYEVIELYTFLDGPTKYCGRMIYCSNIETIKKGYEIKETSWYYDREIYTY